VTRTRDVGELVEEELAQAGMVRSESVGAEHMTAMAKLHEIGTLHIHLLLTRT
jgi:hypothetical protein